jgi:Xaa-Pro aminopeptidase
MFEPRVYAQRRDSLRRALDDGLVVLAGAGEAAMNYRDNPYPFVQDGSFAYLFGLLQPDLVGVIDIDSGEDALFGTDIDLESLVWHGHQPSLAERAARAGVVRTGSPAELAARVAEAVRLGRTVHYPPPYRGETVLTLAALLGRPAGAVEAGASLPLIRALVALREVKGAEEVAEMEAALAVTAEMHAAAMAASRPGVYEREVVAEIERVVRRLDQQLAYPVIFSRSGEILHNHDHSQRLEPGDLIVNDSGAASARGYASDITRTLPVGGFTPQGRELYAIVLDAQHAAIEAARPGSRFVDVHKRSMQRLVEGLAGLGVFRGDPAEVVESGAYAVVCQGGLGHQIGLDVHDMESLGEDLVGYDEEVGRSPLFGLNRLRLGKRLKAGMTVTIEPGLYFIPPLIEAWAAEERHAAHIDYDRLRSLSGAGGLRVEDEVLVTDTGARVLGPPIPKSIEAVEAALLA